jgi:23S rRNA (cytidine1920-2'-O)/16S rRNA (cytidine1409-2'-O)-methyltransferase
MSKQSKERLDKRLVALGLVETRQKAQALILAGQVLVNNQRVDKPGTAVALDAEIRIKQALPYVSRGGVKLAKALDDFGIAVTGKVAMDLGASTGGFTDCLLQRGARKIYAIDVGAGQLDWKLRTDVRVVSMEGVNARYLSPDLISDAVDMVTIDVSFISLALVLPAVAEFLRVRGAALSDVVALVKPQFEVGKGEVGKGGIVRDPAKHLKVIEHVTSAAADLGFEVMRIIESPILGAEGNKEFLAHLRWTKNEEQKRIGL